MQQVQSQFVANNQARKRPQYRVSAPNAAAKMNALQSICQKINYELPPEAAAKPKFYVGVKRGIELYTLSN